MYIINNYTVDEFNTPFVKKTIVIFLVESDCLPNLIQSFKSRLKVNMSITRETKSLFLFVYRIRWWSAASADSESETGR